MYSHTHLFIITVQPLHAPPTPFSAESKCQVSPDASQGVSANKSGIYANAQTLLHEAVVRHPPRHMHSS